MSDRESRCNQEKESDLLTYRDKLMSKTKKELVDIIINLEEELEDLNVAYNEKCEEATIYRNGL